MGSLTCIVDLSLKCHDFLNTSKEYGKELCNLSVPEKFTVCNLRQSKRLNSFLETLSLTGFKPIKQTLHTRLSIQISEKKRGFTKMAHDIRAGYSKNINLFAREADTVLKVEFFSNPKLVLKV